MDTAPVFLMSWPRPDWGIRGGSNFVSSQNHTGPSPRGAMRDWLDIAEAIEDAGGHVLVMPPSPALNLTGLPYTAEAGEFYRNAQGQPCFILPHMKSPHRQPEPNYTAGFVAALGWKTHTLNATWEAQGDAIRIGHDRIVHTYGQGPAARSQDSVYPEVSPRLSTHAFKLHFIAKPWFHGNTFLAWFHSPDFDQQHILVCPEALLEGELERLKDFAKDTQIIEITKEESLAYATNALQVNSTIIAPDQLPPRILSLWRDLGLTVVELGLDQLFRHGGGAAVCLSCRLWGLRVEEVPQHLLFSTQRKNLCERLHQWPTETGEPSL